MRINKCEDIARRAFLKRGGALGIAGVAAPWALNLAAIGEAAAQSATDYKALVCVFLYGGNDHGNTLIPYDATHYSLYQSIRGSTLAIAQANLAGTVLTPATALPDGLQFALAPTMTALKPLFDQGRLAVQLNVGTLIQPTTVAQYKAGSVPLPPKLFSHNDQQSIWQSSQPEGSTTGWGGRMGDLFLSGNTNAALTCMSVTGNAVYLAGNQAIQYQVGTSGAISIRGINNSLFGSSACSTELRNLITQSSTHFLENEYAAVTRRSIDTEALVTSAVESAPTFVTTFNTSNSLAMQLQMVAKMIAARDTFGVSRQVFLVSMGGFDVHDRLSWTQPGLLTSVSDALRAFYDVTVELGIANSVTTFTASDFGRTLNSNGDGSDHGWGGHHFVVGGAVNGGNFYGTAPAIAVDGPDDVGRGRLLPTTSVDQFAATLAYWFGVGDADMATIVPNIGNFTVRNLGFV
ncbi:MAG: DUF1501 domain-containing protein [Gammaproteobacteria bacterium]|nr:DUF1501 domain-containing protein [Gammaproteobacteria bacterium]MBU1414363.1 DUF1501 domain-containing protein [Gammaproteobacteria bacterium]